jgi:hypothetical protein
VEACTIYPSTGKSSVSKLGLHCACTLKISWMLKTIFLICKTLTTLMLKWKQQPI